MPQTSTCMCVYAFLHVEPLGHVQFPSLLCRESRRMSESGHCSIVNNDLQFVNSGTHFSKCQAYFSTIVSGLFSHRALDEDKVTSLWWKASRRETRKFSLSFSSLPKESHAETERGAIFKCLETGRRWVLSQGWILFID